MSASPAPPKQPIVDHDLFDTGLPHASASRGCSMLPPNPQITRDDVLFNGVRLLDCVYMDVRAHAVVTKLFDREWAMLHVVK